MRILLALSAIGALLFGGQVGDQYPEYNRYACVYAVNWDTAQGIVTVVWYPANGATCQPVPPEAMRMWQASIKAHCALTTVYALHDTVEPLVVGNKCDDSTVRGE